MSASKELKRKLPETAEYLAMFITMHMLVMFGAAWNMLGR